MALAMAPHWIRARLVSWIAVLGAVALLIAIPTASAAKPPLLYVFVPSDVRPRKMQQELRGSMSGAVVNVFGRFRDLERAMKTKPPSGLLSTEPVVTTFRFAPAARGKWKGKTKERYVLATLDANLTKKQALAKTVGVIDILGRKGTKRFVSKLLSGTSPKLKRANKLEDLRSLLLVKMVQSVLVPARDVPALSKAAGRTLPVIELDGAATAGLATLGVPNGASPGEKKRLVGVVRGLPKGVNRVLKVDGWE